jgi:hypothetical protein
MSRVAPNNIKTLLIALLVLILAAGSFAVLDVNKQSNDVRTVTNSEHQITQISYGGEQGTDALTLLKRNAAVKTKHYSFGDLVTSINGSEGNGPKYWTFYINGKESTVGAGSYITKDGDQLMWKLQAGD